jgi:hypothetical protein
MPKDAVRVATAEDNEALVSLEKLCPQGTHLRMYSERDDYFYRSRLYGDTRTLVAVDRAKSCIFGVLAAAMKDVRIGGALRPAAYFYDLRLHPEYRRSVQGRHMLTAWKQMEQWAAGRGAHLIYGLVKKDNSPMTALVDERMGYRFAGGMVIHSRPVFRPARGGAHFPRAGVSRPPREIPADDPRLVARTRAVYGRLDFYPEVFSQKLDTPAMKEAGLYSFVETERDGSWASIGIFRASRVMRTRVMTIPTSYRLLGPVCAALSPLVPLPRIPRQGGSIGYTCVFNHLAEGPRGIELWRELLGFANNVALADGADLLTSAFDPFDASDVFRPAFRRGSLNTLEYGLGLKAFSPGLETARFSYFPDVRDMN